jgi:hypothetical protein
MQQKLNLLIDQKFNYKDKVITITKWKKVGVTYVVLTDKQAFNFYLSELVIFLDELQPVRVKLKEGVLEKRQVELKNMEHTPNTPNTLSEKSTDLSEILYDTIDKVKKDKNYIGQANAICNIVSQMINIKKLEIQLKK